MALKVDTQIGGVRSSAAPIPRRARPRRDLDAACLLEFRQQLLRDWRSRRTSAPSPGPLRRWARREAWRIRRLREFSCGSPASSPRQSHPFDHRGRGRLSQICGGVSTCTSSAVPADVQVSAPYVSGNSRTDCSPVRFWPLATNCIFIADGRFRCEADMARPTAASTRSLVTQQRHGHRNFAVMTTQTPRRCKNMLLHSRQGSGEHRPVEINGLVE